MPTRLRTRLAARACVVLLAAAVLPACAGLPSGCGNDAHVGLGSERVAQHTAALPAAGCDAATAVVQLQSVGGVRQRGTQTRTVGVPREFLVTMVVLIVLLSLV